MRLTVIVPTYNESKNLTALTEVLFSLPLPDLKVLVVDDNSPDGTGSLARSLCEQFHGRMCVLERTGKRGLGSAYRDAFQHTLKTSTEAIAQMDADFSHPPEKLVELVDALDTCDVAMGSRYISGGRLDDNWPLWRKRLSAFGNVYARSILGLPIRDATGGFRVWRRATLRALPLHRISSNGYAFQIETAYVAYKLGFKFREIPFYFADRRWGNSKMSLAIQLEAAKGVWEMLWKYRDLTALPG